MSPLSLVRSALGDLVGGWRDARKRRDSAKEACRPVGRAFRSRSRRRFGRCHTAPPSSLRMLRMAVSLGHERGRANELLLGSFIAYPERAREGRILLKLEISSRNALRLLLSRDRSSARPAPRTSRRLLSCPLLLFYFHICIRHRLIPSCHS